MTKKFLLSLIIFLFSINQSLAKKYSITAFYGIGTDAHIEEVPTFSFNIKKAHFVGLAFNKEFFQTKKYKNLSLEYEFGAYQHFGNFSKHQEATIAIIARFNELFPKNWFIESFAIGEGLSMASNNPRFESYLHNHNRANDLLNYLAFELVFKLPKIENTRFIYRLHHRSGVYGLFDNINGGSNYLSFGLRYNF